MGMAVSCLVTGSVMLNIKATDPQHLIYDMWQLRWTFSGLLWKEGSLLYPVTLAPTMLLPLFWRP